MIAVDTSAIVAATLGEPEADTFKRILAETPILIGWPTALERRRLSSWSTLHRLRGHEGPSASPALRQAVKRASKAADRRPARKSKRAIVRDVLDHRFQDASYAASWRLSL